MKASTSDQGRNPCSSLALIRLLFYSSHHLSSRFRFPSTFVSLQNRRHLAPSPRHQTKSGIDTLASKRAQERCSLIHRLLLVPGCCKVKISSFFSPCAGSSCLSSLFPPPTFLAHHSVFQTEPASTQPHEAIILMTTTWFEPAEERGHEIINANLRRQRQMQASCPLADSEISDRWNLPDLVFPRRMKA